MGGYFLSKNQWMRVGVNAALIGTFFYQGLLNNYPEWEVHSQVFLLHQFAISILFYALIYLNLFLLGERFLIQKKLRPFIIGSISVIIVSCLLLAFYQQYLMSHFEPVKEILLLPVHLFEEKSAGYTQQFIDLLFKSFSLYIILLMAFLARNFFTESRKKEILKKKHAELELSLLKAQLNPHFLFNALNGIYALSLKKSDLTPYVVTRLSDMLRYLLYESKAQKVILQKEIQLIQDYLEIQRVVSSREDYIAFEMNGDFSKNKIAPLILLPLVENAVKHGIESSMDQGFIKVSATCSDNRFLFVCTNSFKPKNLQPNNPGPGGIGIAHVKKILELSYPNQHLLKIHGENRIFTASIQLSLPDL